MRKGDEWMVQQHLLDWMDCTRRSDERLSGGEPPARNAWAEMIKIGRRGR